uniref:Endostatin domain-containing protein n=1 Tax=Macrostomum lignano TaxID=282301 RepID=A0A1I8IDY3_9PLAT
VSPGHRRRGHSRPREADADGDSMEPSFSHGAVGKGGTPSQTLSLTSPYPWCGRPARLPLRPDQLAWAAELPRLAFNTFDEASGSERRSFAAAPYSLDAATGRPLNPAGRTGLAGRGRLPAWGPNHRALLLVTAGAPRQARPGAAGAARRLRRRRLPRSRAARPPPAIDGDCRRLLADAQQRQGGQAPLDGPGGGRGASQRGDGRGGPRFRWRLPGRRAEHRQRLAGSCAPSACTTTPGGLWDGVRLKLDSKSRPRWTELSHKSESKFPPGHWRCLEKLIQLRNAYY